jgi:glycerophosphoryl diester phosphodiesterase
MLSDKDIKVIFYIAIVLFLLNIQCKEKSEYKDDSYYGKVIILGHSGMGEMYKMPRNTYESIAPVIAIGADGSEVDIQMTKDSVLVLFHDPTLNAHTTCTGRIYESTWAEIQQCKYYAIQNNIFVNSLDTLFRKLPNLNKFYFSFDCKLDTTLAEDSIYQMRYLRAIKRLCDKYQMNDNVILEGGISLLNRAKKSGLTNKLFLLNSFDESSINSAKSNNYFGISTCMDWMVSSADDAHKNGLYLMIWSPNNDAQNKEVLKAKADIIQTDDPMTLLKLLNRYNYEYVIP